MKISSMRIPEFWERVVDEIKPRREGRSTCWLWIGPRNHFSYSGRPVYGKFSTTFAHCVAAAIYTGEVPSKVFHRCGNPLCMRLEHLGICYMKDRQIRVSALTGKPLQVPVTRDPATIERILSLRGKGGMMDRIRYATRCSDRTIKRILQEAPIYDAIDEVKDLIKSNKEVPRKPHKKEGKLLPYEQVWFKQAFDISTAHVTKLTKLTGVTDDESQAIQTA